MFNALETKYANELEYLQSVFFDLNVNNVNVSILILKIDAAYKAIRNYLRLDETDDVSAYFAPATELAITYYNNYMRDLMKLKGERIIVQQSTGSASNTFETSKIALDNYGLTESVKAMLPYPPIRIK